MKKILIIQGHPDAGNAHFCEVIAQKYVSAAGSAGHSIKQINVADLDFPLIVNKQEFDEGEVCESIKEAQQSIAWANHVVVIYPLWMGDMPALLKGFWEQVLRPGFAMRAGTPDKPFKKLLKGKSARVFVTMGMPSPVYRWFYKAHTVKSLKRNILSFCGFKPVNFSLIGGVYEDNDDVLYHELRKVAHLGRDGG